ncbi:MAG: 50S ribosomal protein L9 [Clostridiales bacterium]|jgi:large subunit ribosomal protein L9|nr:50S ribosomal protein L9 [Clostridiales bacterium]
MKVILQADIAGQGKKGQIITVSDGYARNYLLPRKLAIKADADALNAIKNRDLALQRKKEMEREQARVLAGKLAGMPVRVSKKAGDSGKFFGAVTAKDIGDAFQAQYETTLDHRKIVLDEPIKTYGSYELKIKLFPEIVGTLYVNVTE